jgi:hypothetical protein
MSWEVVILGQPHIAWQCGTCSVLATAPSEVYRFRRQFCPNGHQWGWRRDGSEFEKMRRERDSLKQQLVGFADLSRALDVLSFVPLHPFDCRDSCRFFFHFSSHHTSQTTAAATNPRDIVIAAISLASMGFYLLSDARQFLFEGAPTVYDIAVRLGCSSLPRVATDAFFCSRNALTASLHSII